MKGHSKGFSLIEVILSTAIFVLLVSGLSGSLIYGIQLTFQSGTNVQGSYLAQEGLEVFRNLRDQSFSNLNDGTYGIQVSQDEYSIAEGSDTNGIYTRTITISTIDNETKKLESEVIWDQGIKGSGSVKLISYLTNWRTITGKQGMLIYSDNSTSVTGIKYRILYDDFSWGPEQTVPNYNPPGNTQVRGIKLYTSPTRDEKILIVKNGATPGTQQSLTAMTWKGSSWSKITLLASYSNTDPAWLKSFDGTYLDNGRFLIVYSDGTNIPKYRIWNGSSWSDQSQTLDVAGKAFWIVSKQKPNTNEAMIALINSSQKNLTMYYNGSSFTNLTTHGTQSPSTYGENIDFVWNSIKENEGFLVYNDGNSNYPNIKKWNDSWEESVQNIDTGGVATHNKIVQRPGTEEFMSCLKDSNRDINCLLTDDTPLWQTMINGEIAEWSHDNVERPFDIAFESSGTNGLAVYANGTGVAQRRISKYRYYNASTNTWSQEIDGITLGPTEASAMETVRLIPNSENDYIMVIMAASDQDIWTNVWDGENNIYFTSGSMGPIEQGLYGSSDEDYWYDFSWD